MRWSVTKTSFINGRLEQPGNVVEYDGVPGSNLDPIDEDAKAAKAAAAKTSGKPGLAPAPHPDADRSLVEILDGWEHLEPKQRIAIAVKLGAARQGLTADAANTVIKDEIARRATV